MTEAIEMPKSASPTQSDSEPVPLAAVERELTRRVHSLQAAGEAPMQRACMSNLVIFCNRPELAGALQETVPAVVAEHPARVLLLLAEAGGNGDELTTTISVRARPGH